MSDDAHDQRAEWLAKADILTEALPYMRQHAGKRFVELRNDPQPGNAGRGFDMAEASETGVQKLKPDGDANSEQGGNKQRRDDDHFLLRIK